MVELAPTRLQNRLQKGKPLGRFTLVDRLGAGGMAEVWTATEAVPDGAPRLRALKFLQPALETLPDHRTMFSDEAKIAMRLTHPNIVRVYELGQFDDHVFQVMEAIEGIDLRALIRQRAAARAPIPWLTVAYIAQQVARGMEFAHARRDDDGLPLNIVHRDLSPGNILVGRDGSVRVLDFGVAWAEHRETRTATGLVKGKVGYMAPEMASHQPFDARADIFSLGVVLWEAMTCRRLHAAGRNDLMAVKHRVAPPSIRAFLAEVPEAVDTLIGAMMALEPERRPRTMGAVERKWTAFLDAHHVDEAAARAQLQDYMGLEARPKTRVYATAPAEAPESHPPEEQTVLAPRRPPAGEGPEPDAVTTAPPDAPLPNTAPDRAPAPSSPDLAAFETGPTSSVPAGAPTAARPADSTLGLDLDDRSADLLGRADASESTLERWAVAIAFVAIALTSAAIAVWTY